MPNLFGPLPTDYCSLFFYLSVFGLVFFFLVLFSGLFMIFSKKVGASFYFYLLWLLVIYGVVYIQNRLLYNMCKRSMWMI